jgi:predicted ribosome quality control (RQC) complex YloA/Tae2 family protein
MGLLKTEQQRNRATHDIETEQSRTKQRARSAEQRKRAEEKERRNRRIGSKLVYPQTRRT